MARSIAGAEDLEISILTPGDLLDIVFLAQLKGDGMASFDPRYQTSYNGFLTESVRQRLRGIKEKHDLTLAELGKSFGLSGAFMGNLMNGKKAIRTKHIDGFMASILLMEADGYEVTASDLEALAPKEISQAGVYLKDASLEDIARRANELGFNVTFSQI